MFVLLGAKQLLHKTFQAGQRWEFIKETRKHAFEQESGQEKRKKTRSRPRKQPRKKYKKKLSFFLDRRERVFFFFSYFIVFFYKISPQDLSIQLFLSQQLSVNNL